MPLFKLEAVDRRSGVVLGEHFVCADTREDAVKWADGKMFLAADEDIHATLVEMEDISTTDEQNFWILEAALFGSASVETPRSVEELAKEARLTRMRLYHLRQQIKDAVDFIGAQ